MIISNDPADPVSTCYRCSARRQAGAISPLVLVLVVVLVLAVAGGAGVWFFLLDEREDHAKEAVNAAITPRNYLAFKDMVVNLINDETYELHYLQLSVSLMTRNEKAFKSMEANRPLLLNRMMELLPTWSFKVVMDPTKREDLRKQILNTLLNMPDYPQIKGLEDVLITNMVIQ